MKLPKLTINTKLLLSYLSMALLTLALSGYAVLSLQNLNKLAFNITNQDYLVLDNSKRMLDALQAQENTEKKALIFKDPLLEKIFWTRGQEFKAGIANIKKHKITALNVTLDRLSELQEQYQALFLKEWSLAQAGYTEEAGLLSEAEGKQILDEMALQVRNIGKRAEGEINRNVRLFKDQSMKAFRITIALSVISLIFGITLAILLAYNIARPLKKLEKATALIAEGKFNNDLNMNRGDSIGSLARAFIVMADRLKALEATHRDASPLTGLPGNLAIENHLKERLAAKKRFSLCQLDLDNFKPFADHYGYAWGSEVIKETGQIIRQSVQNQDRAEVFIGHIGGDDFVLIAEPERAEQICQCVLQEFDRRSLNFYAEADRQRGFFSGYDRSGSQCDFPLVTMTIAIVSDDGSRFRNPLEMAEMAAKSKEYAKSLPGSNYVKLEEIEHLLQNVGNTVQTTCS